MERLRLYHGFSQTELAKKAGTTQAIISNIENGDYNPSLDLITRVATALEVKEDLLINDKINWIMLEMINYLMNKLPQKNIDILKAMKLVYFSDLLALKTLERKLSYLEYKRRHRGPFNKDIYLLDQLFKKEGNFYVGEPFATYLALGKEEKEILDQVAEKYGSLSSTELMKLSYETEPMK
ncbi:MAG: helix-turn-helix domain-containing protein [Candidatus Peribacteria bacterium]|nr:helix-turn-helix domain-containing protein [Candidatus Peribacteria bacterium]